MDKSLRPSIIALVLFVILFETTGIDLWFQDLVYDFHSHSWWVDSGSFWPRAFFYVGCKGLAWAVGITALALAIPRKQTKGDANHPRFRRVDLLVLVATLATAPLLIATSKATTNVFTPDQTRRYGGFAPYVKVFEAYPADDRPRKRGRGFPAGHASGGFALMALAGLARSRRGRMLGVATGFAIGWMMGFYQIFKGAHYLSHTVITALFCWIVFLALRRLFRAADCQSPG